MTSATGSVRRDEADDEALDALQREDALDEASRLVVGGIVGVALGVGLGWLASRSFAGVGRSRETVDDVAAAARRAAAALEQARVDVDRQVQRGLRDLRRAARHAAHRVG